MKSTPSTISVAEYCEAMTRRDIIANHEYQRSDKVWPRIAQSYLVETILLGYPMPKLALNQVLDLKSKRTIREIVDGQQRSRAIFDFYNNNLRLSTVIDLEGAKGRTFDDLPDDLKARFLEYALSYDLFTATTGQEVREVFRRMNLYTIPLNPEEQRHAVYQGAFKLFVHHLTSRYDTSLKDMGVLTEKQLVRMQDTKLITEVAHACVYGIQTTSKAKLDSIYRVFDKSFTSESELKRVLEYSLDTVIGLPDVHNTAIMKSYEFYALLLALIHTHNPQPQLNEYFPLAEPATIDAEAAVSNLTILADALENGDPEGEYKLFIEASSSRTNVASQRQERFKWFCRALTESAI